jgi:Kdo2-lipid IVA lauroyltransferase/acyltransferase
MKQNLIADYCITTLFKVVSFFTYFLPLNFSLFFGRRLGDLVYLIDRKHRAIAYANIRRTVGDKLDWRSCARITRKSYQAFCQNLIEMPIIPRINKQYLQKYIQIEHKEYGYQAFDRGKGVIFLIVHEGNWELSNIIMANLDVAFVLFVRDQGFPRLNALLNKYRLAQGAKIMHKDASLRQLIEVLKSNQSVGMTTDQGGKIGLGVDFFGKDASMSTGAVKLALKYDCAIIPIFYTRVKGPYSKVILDQVFTVTHSADPEKDLKDNLQRLMGIYEKYLRRYPHEYLWTYKIYKYSRQREVLILGDGKTGHLRQCQGVAKLLGGQLTGRGIEMQLSESQIQFRSSWCRFVLSCLAKLRGKYQGQGAAMLYLRWALTPQSWQDLARLNPEIIISAGGQISPVNYLLAKECQARSVVLMRPGILSARKFNLAIIPRHDLPVARKNVVVTEGALNLIDAQYLAEKTKSLSASGLLPVSLANACIGVLIGGDSKEFSLSVGLIEELIREIKKSCQSMNADVLITTSRRTAVQVEEVLKKEFSAYPRCKLLVIGRQNNNPDVVGAILGSSSIIISSPESISMVSEAVSAGKYVVVFNAEGLSAKHLRFLRHYQDKKYIYLEQTCDLSLRIDRLLKDKPAINSPQDNLKVIEGLNRIL